MNDMNLRIGGCALLVALASAGGCSREGAQTLPQTMPFPVQSGARHFTLRLKLYVSDPVAKAVHVFQLTGSVVKELATITKGIDAPAGLAVNKSGDLFVANTAGNSVAEYREGSHTPVATFSKDLTGPIDVAVDGSGTLYVANFYSFPHSIVEFPKGSSEPSATIRNPCSCYPTGLTLDGAGNLYVNYENLYWFMYYYEYRHGTTKGEDLGLQSGLKFWEDGGVVSNSAGSLLVANATLPGVQVFAKGGKCHGLSCMPTKTFATQGSPRFLALDAGGHYVFVTNTADNSIDEYSYPAGTHIKSITSGLKSVYGVAVSPPGSPDENRRTEDTK